MNALAVDGCEVEHQAGRLVVGGIEHECLLDAGRAREIEHHARAALHHQAETERLDQAAPLLPGLGRKLEGDLRHVDDHPVGIGEREGADIDLLAEIDAPGASALSSPPRRTSLATGKSFTARVCGAAAPAARPPEAAEEDLCRRRRPWFAARTDIDFPNPLRASPTPLGGRG